jgi:hypothetical protein
MTLIHPRTLAAVLTIACAALISACGGSGALSASAIASCTHAQQQASSALPTGAPTFHAVIAKTAKHGWLRQNTSLTSASTGAPVYEIYVFANEQTAEAAFNLIANDSNAREEYGDGWHVQTAKRHHHRRPGRTRTTHGKRGNAAQQMRG